MTLDAVKDQLATIKLHAEQHEVIKDDDFATVEEYVLQLMHKADYERAALLAHGKSVLDLGCNGGHGTCIVARTCNQIVGVDVSPAAIAAAKKKHESEKMTFRVVDGLTLPFPKHSFDLVTSFQVIEHLADYQAYLDEIRRVLKPDGLLLITTPNGAIRVHPGQKPWNPFHVREFRSSELAELLGSRFQFTRVLGQFASANTYAIEYNRCINARDSLPVVRPLVVKIVRKLWRLLTRGPDILRKKLSGVPSPQTIRKMHSVEDFFYKRDKLDESLSMVACCSSNEVTATEAAAVFLKGG